MTITDKGFAYIILYDNSLEMDSNLFDQVILPQEKEWFKLTKEDWFFYQPEDDEYSYSLKIPGLKMLIDLDITIDEAKTLADQMLTKLKKLCGFDLELVIIDKKKLTTL